jgi:CBS domain-containing protein
MVGQSTAQSSITAFRRPGAVDRPATAPAAVGAFDDTPLLRVRQAMSHHQVDAILVVGRDDGIPLRWVTRDGLVRKAGREPSRQGARQAIGDAVAQLNAGTSLAQLRELLREPDVSRVLIWCNSGPLAIVGADELFTHTVTDRSGSAGGARLRRAPRRSTATPAMALAGHGRRLLGLVARAQPDASGWTSEAQLESMVPGGRLEWRGLALGALTAAGLLDRVQRDGQFDYRLTRNGLELADAHKAPGSSDPGSRPSAAKSR